MKCPTCVTTELLMTERLSIEIDYCPQCRGVWLDRGELDKIIERSGREASLAAPPMASFPAPHAQQPSTFNHSSGHRDKRYNEHHSHHEKKSFWKELFD